MVDEFQQLYQRYTEMVFDVCYKILKNKADAEDAAADTWLKVWRKLKRGQQIRKPKSYILKIVKNAAIDMLRARRRKPTTSLENSVDNGGYDIPGRPPAPSTRPEDFNRILNKCRTALKGQFEIMQSRANGDSFKDIANALSKTEPNVRQLYSRGVKKIYAYIWKTAPGRNNIKVVLTSDEWDLYDQYINNGQNVATLSRHRNVDVTVLEKIDSIERQIIEYVLTIW